MLFEEMFKKQFGKMTGASMENTKDEIKKYLHEHFNFNFDEFEVVKRKTADGYVAEISIPGFKKPEIKVTRVDNQIVVEGKNSLRERRVEFVFYPTKENIAKSRLEDGILYMEFEYIRRDKSKTEEVPID